MNVTKQLYQWDTGQKLTECTGIYVDYLIGDEVYRVEIIDGTCIIPDELLQTSGRYKVWECMADNTLREFAFKVLPRPVPPNYVFTPTEQLTFEGLVQKETNKFNTNAIEKLNAYNANADNRVAEFNAQTEQIQADVSELKSDIQSLNESLSDSVLFDNTLIGSLYIRANGTFGEDSVGRLYKYNVENMVGNTIVFETLYGNEISAPVAGFYSLEFASVNSGMSADYVVELIQTKLPYSEVKTYSVIVPQNAKTLVIRVGEAYISTYPIVKQVTILNVKNIVQKYDSYIEKIYSTNRLNLDKLLVGKACETDGRIVNSSYYCCTDYIGVDEGDTIGIFNDFVTQFKFRQITAYDIDKNAVSSKGTDVEANEYVVPNGIHFVRVTMYNDRVESTTRININGRKAFEPYWEKNMPVGVDENTKGLNNVYDYPLTELPDYVLNTLSYKPLGQLSKPYICFMSDDGNLEDNSYVIPMFYSKNVPCSFAIMKTSEIMQSNEQIALFKDAITNKGMGVSQHGGYVFTKYTEKELMEFIADEKAFFDSIGITMKSAVTPENNISRIVSAVVGGHFGVLRCDYDGTGEDARDILLHYDHYCNGAKSNLYALSSRSATDGNIDTHKSAIDYAVEHNMLYMLHFHGNELTDDKKALLESIIDYAKSRGVTFCKLEDVPTIK